MAEEPVYTETGRREDLESAEVNAPEGYIGLRLFPQVKRFKQAGTEYYRTLVADSAAQTNRSAGAAPASTVLGSTNTTYSCTEIIKRYLVPFETVMNLGGLAQADKLGAEAAKRSVLRALEDLFVDAVMAGSPDASVASNLLDAVVTAKGAIKRYKGRTAFVCSDAVFRLCMKQADVVARLARFTSVQPADNAQILALQRTLLAMTLEVDDVLIGDDDHWHVTTAGGSNNVSTQDRALIAKLPSTDELSQTMDPELGKTLIYFPQSGNPWHVSSYPDYSLKSNAYDAQLFSDIVEFNSGAYYLLDNISANSGS